VDIDELSFLVGRPDTLLLDDQARAIPLGQGYLAVEIDAAAGSCAAAEMERLDPGIIEDLPTYLPVVLDCLGARLRPGGAIAMLSANEYGESSCVFRDGVVLDKRQVDFPVTAASDDATEWPLNQALRMIGVERGDAVDECAAMGIRTPAPATTPFAPRKFPPL
jgi:hypothetical protein